MLVTLLPRQRRCDELTFRMQSPPKRQNERAVMVVNMLPLQVHIHPIQLMPADIAHDLLHKILPVPGLHISLPGRRPVRVKRTACYRDEYFYVSSFSLLNDRADINASCL